MTRIRMGKLSQIPEGGSIEKRILARRIAIFKQNGRLIGIESECKHMKATLANGQLVDGVLTCKWHGWKYRLEDGQCLNQPGMKLRQYEVEIEGDDVYIIL